MSVSITEDFEGGATGWTDNSTVTDAGFSQYLVLDSGSAQPIGTSKTFDVSAGEGDITVTFDLYEIDDIDNDEFLLFVGGTEIFELLFDENTNEGTRSGVTGDVAWTVTPVTAPTDIGGDSGDLDQIHRVTLVITNAGSSLTLGFGEGLSGGGEFFGIDNLSITRAGAIDPVDAIDDGVTVNETDAPGDVDINVLANDVNAGSVSAVNGASGNVGTAVAGTNGGLFTIDANGNVDFDANGEFSGLLSGDTATTSITYDASNVAALPKLNIVYVVDESGSTVDPFGGTPVGDLDGDGVSNTILDASIASLQALTTEIAALGLSNDQVDITLVSFESTASNLGTFNPGDAGLNVALAGLDPDGGTNYEAGLQTAIGALDALSATSSDRNVSISSRTVCRPRAEIRATSWPICRSGWAPRSLPSASAAAQARPSSTSSTTRARAPISSARPMRSSVRCQGR